MEIVEITSADAGQVQKVWEASVRATHLFLKEEDILFYRTFVKKACEHSFVSFFGVREEGGRVIAFLGISGSDIDMLFVQPSFQAKGIGSKMIDFAIRNKKCNAVDVNEQNIKAVEFYLHKGFRILSRSEIDEFGKHYPILHLHL